MGFYSAYLGTVSDACLAESETERFPITTVSPLNGGVAFAGKSGRNTAGACEANAMETIRIAAALFMSRGLTRLPLRGKENFRAFAVIRRGLA